MRIKVCLLLIVGAYVFCLPQEKQDFQLHILSSNWDELNLGYEREQAWTILKELDPGNSAVTVTENDVEVYDWSQQTITLTPEASTRLRQALAEGEYLSTGLDHQAFVVILDGTWLYGGVFLQTGSPMAIGYPVIYAETDQQDRIIFQLRPAHPLPARYQDLDPLVRGTIEIQEIRAFFLERDKLVE